MQNPSWPSEEDEGGEDEDYAAWKGGGRSLSRGLPLPCLGLNQSRAASLARSAASSVTQEAAEVAHTTPVRFQMLVFASFVAPIEVLVETREWSKCRYPYEM